MISLFPKRQSASADVVTLPVCCVPNETTRDLDAKRAAQLQWMRDNGMHYLGEPVHLEARPQRRTGTSLRLVHGAGATTDRAEFFRR
jgi:hypothetical protein